MIGWLDIAATSEYCCTGKRTIEKWIKSEGLRYVKVGGKRLIKRQWLDQFLEEFEVDKQISVDKVVDEICKDITNMQA